MIRYDNFDESPDHAGLRIVFWFVCTYYRGEEKMVWKITSYFGWNVVIYNDQTIVWLEGDIGLVVDMSKK